MNTETRVEKMEDKLERLDDRIDKISEKFVALEKDYTYLYKYAHDVNHKYKGLDDNLSEIIIRNEKLLDSIITRIDAIEKTLEDKKTITKNVKNRFFNILERVIYTGLIFAVGIIADHFFIRK